MVYAFIALAIYSLMMYLYASSFKPAKSNENGVIIIRKNKIFSIFGFVTIIGSVMFYVYILTVAEVSTQNIPEIFGLTALELLINLICSYLIIDYIKVRIEADEQKIIYCGVFGKNDNKILWKDIVRVTYREALRELTIYSDNKKMIVKLNTYIGTTELLAKVAAKIYPSTFEKI